MQDYSAEGMLLYATRGATSKDECLMSASGMHSGTVQDAQVQIQEQTSKNAANR